MPSLKEVRNRIASIRSTQQITKAMKMVAAAKLRRAQDRMLQMRPYARQLQGMLDNVIVSAEQSQGSVYSEQREPNRVLIVIVTSDRGLCAGFNTNITKATIARIHEKYASQHAKGNLTLMCVGRRGRDFFKRRGYKIEETYTEMFSTLRFENVKQAAEAAMNGFVGKEYDVVEIVYNEFKNVATQMVRVETFLPLLEKPKNANEPVKQSSDYIFEPNAEEIVKELLPKYLKVQFYRALLESNAAEQGARMTAMDKATENAGEILKELRLTYNRSRQAAITKEILEIVGGAEALSNG